MKVSWFAGLVVVALAVLFGVEARGRFSADLQSARITADSARKMASAAVSGQKAAEAFAAANQLLVFGIQEELDSAKARAASAQRRLESSKVKFVVAAAAAPDTCGPVIAAADSALAAADTTIAADSAALRASERARGILQSSLDSVRSAARTLAPATINVSAALDNLERASHQPFYLRLLPHPGFGASYGIDAGGIPHLVTGFTLGWTF